MAASTINVSQVVNDSPLSGFQIGTFVLCFVCLAMDGFDVQSLGYVAPALTAELGITRQQLGTVVSAAPLGLLIGSVLFSTLADYIGRRPVLLIATFLFSVLTLFTARAASLNELLWLRVIAGLGMGAIMPNAMALTGEFSPRRSRVTIMMIVGNGFTAGAALGGFVAAALLPVWGWRSVFYFGAAVPLLLTLVMFVRLPESLQFLALKGDRKAALVKWLNRVQPQLKAKAEDGFEAGQDVEGRAGGITFLRLFDHGRAWGTTLLWVINFMNLLNLYFLQGLLTTVLTDRGIDQSTAALIASMIQVGGTVGAFTLGFMVHRVGFVPVLASCSLIACITIGLIGQSWIAAGTLFAVVLIAGFCVTGGQAAINALSGNYYPTELRSTGLGAALGIGRLGAIVGPPVATTLMAAGWTPQQVFLSAAVPALLNALLFLVWGRVAHMRQVPAPKKAALVH